MRIEILSICVAAGLAAMPVQAADGGNKKDNTSDVIVSLPISTELSALMADSRVKKALAYIQKIEKSTGEADLIKLTETEAPPFAEATRASLFKTMLEQAGYQVSIDKVGNVIGRLKGKASGKRTVAVAAHMDTVFPKGTNVKVRREGKRLIAPGIGDNTRGMVMMLNLARAFKHAAIQPDADILFIGNVGEEGLGDLRGVKHLFGPSGVKIDSFIAIDGGSDDRLVYGGVGSHRYRVTFKGPGGHSWGAFGMANPHHALGRAIAEFDNQAPAVTTVGPKTSYSIGRIGGGTSINSIPFESWMEIDMRSGDQSKLDDVDAVMKAAMAKALTEENAGRTRGPELTVDIKMVGKRPAGVGDKNGKLVQRMVAAMKVYGVQAKLAISSTDSNIPISKGVPAITISRGGISSRAHSLDEWWEDADAYRATQIGFLALLAEAGL